MPFKDLTSNIRAENIDNVVFQVPTSGSVSLFRTTNVVNASDAQSIMFAITVADINACDIRFDSIEESDDESFATFNTVADNKLIGNSDAFIDGTNFNSKVLKLGVFSTKNYLRARVVQSLDTGTVVYSVAAYTRPTLVPVVDAA